MPFNICFEGVSGKRGIFLNGKLVIEVFFLSRPAIDFSYPSPFPFPELHNRTTTFIRSPSHLGDAPDPGWHVAGEEPAVPLVPDDVLG